MNTAINYLALQGHIVGSPKVIGRGSRKTGFIKHVRLRIQCPRPVLNGTMEVDVIMEERGNEQLWDTALSLKDGEGVIISGRLDLFTSEDNLYATLVASVIYKGKE